MFKGGESLMLAAGFQKLKVADPKSHSSASSLFYFQYGSSSSSSSSSSKKTSKSKTAAPKSKAKSSSKSKTTAPSAAEGPPKSTFELTIAGKIADIDAELLALDGIPSVSSAIRFLREGDPTSPQAPPTLRQCYFAVDQVLSIVSNLLKHPKDSRMHRIRTANPAFQRTVGRWEHGSTALMEACGFELIEGGTVYALKRLGGSPEDIELVRPPPTPSLHPCLNPPANDTPSPPQAKTIASSAGTATGPLATFKFPDLDSKTTAFLNRKRSDLMQAIDAISNIIDEEEYDPATRAKHDLEDAGVTSGGKKGSSSAAAAPAKGKKKSEASFSSSSKKGSTLTSELDLFLKGKTNVQRAQLAMLKQAFDLHDFDKNGVIDANDLKNYWRYKGEESTQTRIDAFITERDIKRDGTVTFEEFAVSFSAALQPETSAWASVDKSIATGGGGKKSKGSSSKSKTKKPSAASGELDPADVDDGATALAAAFGALRLTATIPQVMSAATSAQTYIQRILEVPSAKTYWRIKTDAPQFSETIGKFYGGIALMKAFGFNLEENGSVLALTVKPEIRGSIAAASHTKWDRPPQEVLASLRADLAELKQHMDILLSPEISDIAAVSSAVARLRNPSTNEASSAALVIETIVFFIDNIIKSPSDLSKRSINCANTNFQRRVAAFQGGQELLVACGFRMDTATGCLVFEGNVSYLQARSLELHAGLALLQK
jgi:hypothetical protein